MRIKSKLGFTLIELLVVISIIGLLSTFAVIALDNSRKKARDARRKSDLKQLALAAENRYNSLNTYPGTAGWFSNPNHGGLDAALTTSYINKIPDDPRNSNGYNLYVLAKRLSQWRFLEGTDQQFGFYARLENPSAEDQATITDSFDTCVRTTWGMNFKTGN